MRRIHELETERDGQKFYIYFARIGGKWVDLAPFGNRIPE